jgi:hypothetical protein
MRSSRFFETGFSTRGLARLSDPFVGSTVVNSVELRAL